jgi:hypothetical protein
MTRLNRRFSPLGAALALGALATVASAQGEGRTRIDTTFAFNKGGSLDLGIVSGTITVTGWTRQEAKVVATTDRGWLETSFSPNRIAIEIRDRDWRGRRRNNDDDRDARYELMVPIGTRVKASAVSGDIRIKATAGEVQANTVSGDVEVLDATDRVVVSSVSGSVHAAKLRGRVRVDGVSADVTVEDVVGDIGAKTVSGEITIHGASASQVRAETVSGEISYEGTVEPSGTYEFNAHSGDVRLRIPAGLNANLALETFSGEINSAFPMTLQPGENIGRRRGKKMDFTIGSGGARVSVGTFSGDITIERSGRSNKEE